MSGMAARRREVHQADQRHSAGRALRLLLAASLLVPASLFATASWITYRSVAHDTVELAGREAEVLKEHAAKVFETAALVLSEIDTTMRGEDDAAARGEEEALHR